MPQDWFAQARQSHAAEQPKDDWFAQARADAGVKTEPAAPAKRSWFEDAWEAVKAVPDVARLLIEEPAATIQGGLEGGWEGAKGVAPTVARVAPAMAAAPLGPLGMAAGAAGGEALAELIEGRKLNPTQIGVQGVLGLVPALGATPLARVAGGGAMGAIGSAATDLAEGRDPSLGGMGAGALFGAGTAGAFERFMPQGAAPDLPPATRADVAPTALDVTPGAATALEIPENLQGTNTFAGPERRSVVRNAADDAEFARARQTEIQRKLQSGEITLEDTIAKRPDAAMKEAGEAARRAQAEAEGRPTGRASAAEVPPAEPTASTVQDPDPSVINEQAPNLNVPRAGTRTLEQVVEAMGQPIPSQKPLDAARRAGESKLLDKLPEPMRPGMKQIFDDNEGFEAARRGVQPMERTQRLADYIQHQVKENPRGTALNAEEITALARQVASNQDQISKVAEKVTAGNATDLDLLKLASLREQQAVLSANYLGARAETGRALNIQKSLIEVIESKDMLALQEAMSNPKIREDLQGFAKKWATLTTDEARLEFLRANRQSSLLDKARSYYFANILSSPKTHLRNVIGNGMAGAFEIASKPGAYVYDLAKHAATGSDRTVFAGEFAPRVVGAVTGLQEGLRDGLFTLTHGYTPKALDTFDVPRPEFAGGGKNPFNWTGRLLEAEDQVFYNVAYRQELYSRLYAKARGEASKQGIKGKALGKFVEDRMATWAINTPTDVRKATEAAAKRQVFKEEPGKVVNAILNFKENTGPVGKLMNFVVPFVKTPANIMRQGIEATPLAPMTSQFREAVGKGGREQSEAIGRAATGTIGLGILAMLAAQGKISGKGPSDANERAALQAQGWQPNSVKVGDKWYDFSLLQPLSQPLYVMANAWEEYTRTGGRKPPDPGSIAAAAGASLLDQSFLSGLSDLNAAVGDPERYGSRFASRMAQGFVPFSGAARSVAQGMDPVVRESKTIAEGVKAALPGLSQTVNPKLDTFGAPIKREGSAIERAVSPVTRKSVGTKDPVTAELARLDVTSLGAPPTKLQKTERAPERDLTNSERQQIGVATREALVKLFSHPRWKELDQDVARDQIGKVVATARHQAYQRLRQQKN